jgi:parallel beta-helix repeat protein
MKREANFSGWDGMKRLGSTLMKLGRFARLALIASTLSLVAASNSHAGCGTMHTLSPTTCGVVISVTGCYTFAPPVTLTATSNAGDCIEITAPNVFLNIEGSTITGTGASSTGNGIHVASTAAGAAILGNGDFSGFNIGILAQARVRLEFPYVSGDNTDGIQLNGAASSKIVSGSSLSNGRNGVTVINSTGYAILNFNANDNAVSGIAVTTSNGGEITNSTASSNALAGISLTTSNATNISASNASNNGSYGMELIDSNANKILSSFADTNSIYGIYLKESASNVLGQTESDNNPVAEVYLGCSDTSGPNGLACATPSKANEIEDQLVLTGGGTEYGIAIDTGNKANTVVGSSGFDDSIDDMYDANLVNQNTWFANSFSSANQTYIH